MTEELATRWSKRQVMVQEWVATPRYARIPPNQVMLAEQIGIHPKTINKWKNKLGWQEAVIGIARAGLAKGLPEVYGALLRGAEEGNIQHIRTVLELVGDLGPEVDDSRTQIAIVFNDKTIQAQPHQLGTDVESEESIINILPIQRGGLRQEMGQNGNGDGADVFGANGNR